MLPFLIKRKYLILVTTIIIFALFWVRTFTYLDPDFGYRLRNGQIILEEGIKGIRTDPYSYTMPSFEFVEHSWMSALFIAISHSAFGMVGTTFIFAIIALISLGVATLTIEKGRSIVGVFEKVFRKSIWHFGNPILLLSLSVIIGFVGVRVQVISWIFLSTLFFLVFNSKRWEKYKYFLPALFSFWVNLHASFFEGMFVLFAIVFFRAFNFEHLVRKENFLNIRTLLGKSWESIRKVKLRVWDLVILASSFLATLINPYGIGAWKKVLQVASSGSLRWNIKEWMPIMGIVYS